MTFSYVGYVWALFGCACLSIFVGGVALALHLIGRRVDRRAPATSVESIALRGRTGNLSAGQLGGEQPGGEQPGGGPGPGDDAA